MKLLVLTVGMLVAAAGRADDTPAEIVVAPRGQWISKPMAVRPLARYRLTFRAKAVGGPTLESDPEVWGGFYDVQRVSRGLLLPRWELRFRTASGQPVKGWGILYPYWNSVLSGAWRPYVDVFYAPPGAERLEVVYLSPDARTTLRATAPALAAEAGDTVNVNPDFSLGRYCHAGYGMAGFGSSVQMLPKPDGGGFFLRVATWCNMDPVPVTAGRRYRVAIRLRPDTFAGARSTVSFEGDDGKPIKNSGGGVLAKKADLGGEETFRAPPGATRMKMLIGAADYESIRVEEVVK